MNQEFISLRGVTKIFDESLEALRPLDLKIQRGEFLSILGPSGCGKSTLLRLISRLEGPTGGELRVQVRQNKMAFVFQEAHLLPWRTALKNVLLPLEFENGLQTKDVEKAEEALSLLGLKDFARSYPHQLSGGMKMRVSLARALVTEPELLLLDEPFAALDEITRQRLDEDLRSLWEAKKMTVLFVTHSIQEAAFLSNRSLVFSKRPGRVVFDQVLKLPNERHRELKTDPVYIQTLQSLLGALENSGAYE